MDNQMKHRQKTRKRSPVKLQKGMRADVLGRKEAALRQKRTKNDRAEVSAHFGSEKASFP